MSEDRIIAHTLEQATSSDFNAAQAIQSRRLDDVVAALFAPQPVPIGEGNSAFIPPSDIVPGAVITGLQVFGIGQATRIGAGTLTQIGASWLSTPDPTSNIATGMLRAPILMPYVSTAGLGLSVDATDAYHLLCARLIEVVTLTTSVNVFDVPSQSFVATSLTKRVELRPEFKWVLGAPLNSNATVWPALDAGGAGWEPLAYVNFVYPGGTANTSNVVDVARRSAGLSLGWQNPGDRGQESRWALPSTLLARLGSGRSPDCGAGNAIAGVYSGAATGEINGERALLASSPDHRATALIDAEDGSAPTNMQLVHYYLCPLESTDRRRWPLKSRFDAEVETYSSVARGLLVGSIVQPTRRKTNSASITLYEAPGTRGKWAYQSAIPAGAAQYLGSGYSYGSSRFGAIYPIVQTSGGEALCSLGEQYYFAGNWTYRWHCPEVLAIPEGIVTSLNRAYRLDLRAFVPRVASTVLLHVQLLGSSDYALHHYEIRNRVDTSGNASPSGGDHVVAYANSGERVAVGVLIPNAAEVHNVGFDFPCCTIEVPVGWAPAWDHGDASVAPIEGYHLDLVLRQVSRGAGTWTSPVTVRLLGWKI
jgi:hypothetical protein